MVIVIHCLIIGLYFRWADPQFLMVSIMKVLFH